MRMHECKLQGDTKALNVYAPYSMCRSRGGLEAERAERVKCKQEDMERDRRNFEAMQVCITHSVLCLPQQLPCQEWITGTAAF